MSARTLSRDRVDPNWETDGPAARREQRRRHRRSATAFAAAVVAVGFAAFAWSIELGLAALVGIRLTLAVG